MDEKVRLGSKSAKKTGKGIFERYMVLLQLFFHKKIIPLSVNFRQILSKSSNFCILDKSANHNLLLFLPSPKLPVPYEKSENP